MLGDGTTLRGSDAEEARSAESYWGQRALTNAFVAFEGVVPWHALGPEHTTDLPQRVHPTSVHYRFIAARRDFAASMDVAPGLRERLQAQRSAAAQGWGTSQADGGSGGGAVQPQSTRDAAGAGADAAAVAPATPAAASSGFVARPEQRAGLNAPALTAQLIAVEGGDGVAA